MAAIVARGVGLAGSGYVLTQAILFVAYLVLARLITPKDFGHFTAGALIAGVGTLIGDSGMAMAVIRRQDHPEEVAATAFVSTLVTGAAMAVIAIAGAPLLGLYYHSHQVTEIGLALGGWLLLRMLAVVPAALLQRQLSFLRRVIVDPLAAIAYLTAAVIAGAEGMGAWTLVVATYASATVTTLSVWLFARWRPHLRLASRKIWRELARFGRSIVASEFLTRITQEVPVLGIGRFIGAAPLGQYWYAARVATQPVGAVINGATYVLLPSFALLASDRGRLRAAFMRSLRAISALSLPASLILVALGRPAIVVLFGPTWRPAGDALMALGIFCAPRALQELAGEIWKVTGHVDLLPKMQAWALVLTVALVAATVPLGLTAVCAALTVASLLVALYALHGVRVAIGIPMRATLLEVGPAAAAAVVMAAVTFALDRVVLHAGTHGRALDLVILAGEALFAAALYLVALDRISPASTDELRTLLQPLARRLRRRSGRPAAPPIDPATQAWCCEFCGMLYDPFVGDPESGIGAGTPFAEIPESWFCPVCGTHVSGFQPVES